MARYESAQPSSRSRQTVRIPFITSNHINAFTGSAITDYGYSVYNGIIDSYNGENDRLYVTQRPAVKIVENASTVNGVGSDGRGIHYWSKTGVRYAMNDDTIYKGTYETACTLVGGNTAIASGTEKVYFFEFTSTNPTTYAVIEHYLFIIDPENNNAYVIASANPSTVINLSDYTSGTGSPFHASDSWDFSDLPFNQTPQWELCHGGASLDGYLFLGCKDGKIFHSNVGDFLNWNSLSLKSAERENDQLLHLTKSKDHIVAIGERTIEFFYNNANPTGSVLEKRKDIFHSVGCVSGETIWVDGDDIWFLGLRPTGDFLLYQITNFQLATQASSSTLNSYFKHSRIGVDWIPKVSGASTGGHTYVIVSLFTDTNLPKLSVVWDAYSTAWYRWSTNITGLDYFPMVGKATRTPEVPVTFEGIMSNGDIFYLSDNFVPVDSTTTNQYFLDPAYNTENDTNPYSLTTGAASDELSEDNIAMQVIISNFDMNSSDRKFMHSLEYVGSTTKNAQVLNVEWSDDERQNWLSGVIDIQNRSQINRLGSFINRHFRASYSGDEQIIAEALDANLTMGKA